MHNVSALTKRHCRCKATGLSTLKQGPLHGRAVVGGLVVMGMTTTSVDISITQKGILRRICCYLGSLSKYLKKMNEEELEEYDSLLNELDWDIYSLGQKISNQPLA
nr:BFH_HP1_G0048650.mRNA.1.CDS.1 [Saccharomyces cerevisiae]